MDAFDGDSDLSDVSAPPTPGPAATPRAASSDPASAQTTTDLSRPTPARRTSRRGAEIASEPLIPATTEHTPSKPSSSTITDPPGAAQSTDTPTSTRRASTRDRKPTAKLRSHSPPAEKSSPSTKTSNAAPTSSSTAGTPKSVRRKVKLNVKGKSSIDGESGSSRGATPQPGSASASGTKITIKMGVQRKKLSEDLRDLADDDDDEQDGNAATNQEEADDFVPDEETKSGKDAAEQQTSGKRSRNARNKAPGRRRTVVADDEEDEDEAEEAPKAPQRKRAKLSDSPAGGAKAKGPSTRGGRKAFDYSDDEDEEDEEMVDAASDEDDLADAAALDTDEEFDHEDRQLRGNKARKAKSTADSAKKAGGRASTAAAKLSGSAGGKKATIAAATSSAASNANAGKAMSAEARMRASIDAALDKSLKPSGASAAPASKLNPQASAFRPSGAAKSGPGGASTPTGAGRPGATPSAAAAGGAGVKRPSTGGGSKPAFGKSMSGWDQLFGGISGLSTASASNKSTPTKPAGASKPSTPTAGAGAVSGTGIRPDPVLESASLADVQRLKEQAVEEHLNTDECFDLLAHADIMLAFERSVYMEDQRLALRMRPAFWKAGMALQGKQQQHQHQHQQ
ncbi:uncharacterized protein UTRI_04293 [Ustilago trichophora]|uniref:Uncharacterized protein n=1 Tax=Ustilago trichophora TaxID=86804 RepID=A0A5C3ET39_9BASI|nr:uncharacterized protein UTRI_04293 [Ustilago trichophora]